MEAKWKKLLANRDREVADVASYSQLIEDASSENRGWLNSTDLWMSVLKKPSNVQSNSIKA